MIPASLVADSSSSSVYAASTKVQKRTITAVVLRIGEEDLHMRIAGGIDDAPFDTAGGDASGAAGGLGGGRAGPRPGLWGR